MKKEYTRQEDELLRSLLAPLVAHWGHEVVLQNVRDNFQTGETTPGRTKQIAKRHRVGDAGTARGNRNLARLDVSPDVRDLVLLVASRFENKEFLPTAGDVRNFVAHHGHEPNAIKDRRDGFSLVLKLLASMPLDDLRGIVTDNKFSGPSELGPIADAIRSFRRADAPAETEMIEAGADSVQQTVVGEGGPEKAQKDIEQSRAEKQPLGDES